MPSIGKDLAKIRTYLGYSVHDMQQATKIPVSTIQTIEDSSIFTKSAESHTYIRSFVRSYGKALKLSDDIMIKALDQQEAGNYNQLLLQQFPELSSQRQPEDPQEPDQFSTETDQKDIFSSSDPDNTEDPEKKETQPSDHKKAEEPKKEEFTTPESKNKIEDDKSADQGKETAAEKKPSQVKNQYDVDTESVKRVDWANMGKKMHEEKKSRSGWIFGIILLISVVAAAGYFLYQNGFFDFTDGVTQTEESQTTQGSITLDIEPPEPEIDVQQPTEAIAELDNVLYITVYAAHDVLSPVRVWSDMKPRMDPYWIEHGVGLNFEFQDTIRIRGYYENSLLFMNGHLIENAFDEYYNPEEDYIELTRNIFTADPRWATSVSFEIPEGVAQPDSIADRPSF